jgi:hypothetical protein
MTGSLNDILPEPVSEQNEKVIMDLLKRKMSASCGLAVQLLHAMEKRFGPAAREVVREMAKNQTYPLRENQGTAEQDMHEFCAMIEKVAAGSHRWQKIINEPDRIGYNYTRCLYAEIFQELGEPELGWVICARDEPWVKSYNPGIGFKRTQTLMQGHKVCDHFFYIENKPE